MLDEELIKLDFTSNNIKLCEVMAKYICSDTQATIRRGFKPNNIDTHIHRNNTIYKKRKRHWRK